MTVTARSETRPGSRTSSVCWTWPAGRPRCGSSSARSATPGAQLQSTDLDGHRFTSPLKGCAHNQLWCEIVALACALLAWTQLLAPPETTRRWEPKLLRLRLLSAAWRLVRGGRRLRLRLAAR